MGHKEDNEKLLVQLAGLQQTVAQLFTLLQANGVSTAGVSPPQGLLTQTTTGKGLVPQTATGLEKGAKGAGKSSSSGKASAGGHSGAKAGRGKFWTPERVTAAGLEAKQALRRRRPERNEKTRRTNRSQDLFDSTSALRKSQRHNYGYRDGDPNASDPCTRKQMSLVGAARCAR